jgi:hypothetical protein
VRPSSLLAGLLLSAIPAVASPAEEAAPPLLTAATYAATRDRILPAPEEERWREIGWRASLLDAAREGRRLEKPILLWAMNGHPLGCT